ncbi:hypothetical protein DFJ58DRAFT_844250 [Suillus subalutaceus]|uniref:uncharacterized protein n=1 Tax=Suillus subalutaceus TaxID=48586 RepID=UPI001B867A68|nr:uncharacterized protein DFJ58DRAFT_844250 [Suillus subalutaceus]KAG1843554.1 hypothetical protein DFJ58DRAFT_844250 [Suillus subalutaceus]
MIAPRFTVVRPLEGFRTIGTGIYLRDIHEQCQDTKSPNVVLIFGWRKFLMGANPRHLRNYTSAYAKLYPKASQIIVQCNRDLFWTTSSARNCHPEPNCQTHRTPNRTHDTFYPLRTLFAVRKPPNRNVESPHLAMMGLHTPRLYLFSREDNLVSCQEVTRHAGTAKERGMDVRCELFEESAHVVHLLVEPERYWSSVQEV